MESESWTWSHITEQIFECVKRKSEEEHGTHYEPAEGNTGICWTKVSFLGKVVLKFNLANEELTYVLVEKPGVVPASSIKSGINSTIESCRG
jgi:hypothetical protein